MRLFLVGCLTFFTLPSLAGIGYPLHDPLSAGLAPPPACASQVPSHQLNLTEVLSFALCHNPQTQAAAWDVLAREANVGVAKSAYLPTLDSTVQTADSRMFSYYPTQQTLDNSYTNRYQDYALNLSWMLYDFGSRASNLRYARALLRAAEADQESSMLTVMRNVVRDYYNALTYAAAVDADQENLQRAQQLVVIASSRVQHGVAPVSDQLQAETSSIQAQYALTQAERSEKINRGTLAVDMGLPPTLAFKLGSLQESDLVHTPLETIQKDLQHALLAHPQLRALQAQLDAAQAHEEQIRDEGRPSIKFTTRGDRNSQAQTLGLGSPYVPARLRTVSFALEINIPLFEGFSRTYQIEGAEADVHVQEKKLEDAAQQIRQNVWTSFENVKAGMENIQVARNLLSVATQSEDVTRQRYQHGAASMLDVINTQTSLANAHKQYVEALAQALEARLELANSIGYFGL